VGATGEREREREREREKEAVVDYFGMLSWNLSGETEIRMNLHDICPSRDSNLALPKYKSVRRVHLEGESGICFLK
jgi:hypothetical protein